MMYFQVIHMQTNVMFKGCGATRMSTTNDEGLPYNDNYWHHLIVRRTGRFAVMTIDQEWIGDVLWTQTILFLFDTIVLIPTIFPRQIYIFILRLAHKSKLFLLLYRIFTLKIFNQFPQLLIINR